LAGVVCIEEIQDNRFKYQPGMSERAAALPEILR